MIEPIEYNIQRYCPMCDEVRYVTSYVYPTIAQYGTIVIVDYACCICNRVIESNIIDDDGLRP